MVKFNQKGFAPIVLLVGVIIVAGALAAYYFYLPKSDYKLPIVTTNEQRELFLKLYSPNENTSAIDNEVLIKGKTLPNTTVAIFNEEDAITLEADEYGDFMSKLMVGQGENNLTITAFGDEGEEKTLKVSLNIN